jgi:enoyl-CoA hydratase/carnithine racemase
VGLGKALELCWLGDMIDATEALRIGLVNRVVPEARFAEEVRALAARLAAGAQTTIRLTKRTLSASLGRSLGDCLEAEIEAQEICWRSPDVAEGTSAFLEKRPARFEARPEPIAGGRFE